VGESTKNETVNLEVHMDAITLAGVALIGMLPNIGVAITLWLGNKSTTYKGNKK